MVQVFQGSNVLTITCNGKSRCKAARLFCSCIRQRALEQLEVKMSALKKELVIINESLNQAILEKDVLESTKEGLSGALCKVSMTELKVAIDTPL